MRRKLLLSSPVLLDEVLDLSELVVRQEFVPFVRNIIGATMDALENTPRRILHETCDDLRRSSVEIEATINGGCLLLGLSLEVL